jgi:hypothetical protein
MAFDIYQKIVNEDGEPIEKKAGAYRQQLFELFVESPEGQALIDEGIQPGWADMMMDYGINYLGVTPPKMSSGNLSEILFDLFPSKVKVAYALNFTIVTPSPPSCGGAEVNDLTRGWWANCSRIAERKAPVPLPCTMRTEDLPDITASFR